MTVYGTGKTVVYFVSKTFLRLISEGNDCKCQTVGNHVYVHIHSSKAYMHIYEVQSINAPVNISLKSDLGITENEQKSA